MKGHLSRRALLWRGITASLISGANLSWAKEIGGRQSRQLQSIEKSEFWISEGDVRLYAYRKRVKSSSGRQRVLLLSHGSSISSVPSFDLQIQGHQNFSMMDYFAQRGFDVWTFDYEGYGRSSRTSGNSNIARGVFDLDKVARFIHEKTGETKLYMYGESSGALRVGSFAEANPDKVAKIALGSLSYTGEGSPTLEKRKEGLEFLKTHDRRPRDKQMILSIFTRDKAGTYDPAVPEAQAAAELAIPNNDTVPTGTYLDMVTLLPILNPQKMTVPTLIIRGEYDGIATESDVLAYFSKISCADREFRLIPGATHAVGLGNQRVVAWESISDFFGDPSEKKA